MGTSLRLKKKSAASRSGFTLVEVVLAMGVASFGLISMMGLLTVGLKTAKEAISATTETAIAQQMANQLQVANYSSIKGLASDTVHYFTQEGIEQPTSTGAIYTATVKIPKALVVPGATEATSLNTKTFVVEIKNLKSAQPLNAIPIQIANNGL